MKLPRLLLIPILFLICNSLSAQEICKGTGYSASYTLRDNAVCEGTGYSASYTIRDNAICEGTGYTAA